MIRSLASGMSLMDQWYAAQYWQGHVKDKEGNKHDIRSKSILEAHKKLIEKLEAEKTFYNFVKWCKLFNVWYYPLRKYRKEINTQKQIMKEKITAYDQHKEVIRLDQQFPYAEISKDDKNKQMFKESWHYSGRVCSCEPITRKGAYRDEGFQLSSGETLYYYHQHCIVAKMPDGSMILDSCGYRTVTTKQRINRYLPSYTLYQQNYEWKLAKNWKDKKPIMFYDGMVIKR